MSPGTQRIGDILQHRCALCLGSKTLFVIELDGLRGKKLILRSQVDMVSIELREGQNGHRRENHCFKGRVNMREGLAPMEPRELRVRRTRYSPK